ncbi:MAG: hypothetical protein WCO23_04465 [bacterium]
MADQVVASDLTIEAAITEAVDDLLSRGLNALFDKEYKNRLLAICLREIPIRSKRPELAKISRLVIVLHRNLLEQINCEFDLADLQENLSRSEHEPLKSEMHDCMAIGLRLQYKTQFREKDLTLKEYLGIKVAPEEIELSESFNAMRKIALKEISIIMGVSGIYEDDRISPFRQIQIDQILAFIEATTRVNTTFSKAHAKVGEDYSPKSFEISDLGAFANRDTPSTDPAFPQLVWVK